MGRPKRTIQKKPSGIYQVVLWINGKRYAKSLETRDQVRATKRASQAIAEIQESASVSAENRWTADTEGVEWNIPTNPDGSNDFENATPHKITWGEIAEPEQIKVLDWRDLVNEAVAVRKRKTGTDYSPGWYQNQKFAIQRCPFSLSEATPVAIRAWMKSMEAEGLAPRSLEINCSTLQSLIKISIKSGLLHDMEVNPFTRVDFSTNEGRHIYTAIESDYRGLPVVLATIAKNQRLAILMQTYTGCRISEIQRRGAESFDLDQGVFSILSDRKKKLSVKNDPSERVIPIPMWLAEELKDFNFKWPSNEIINRKLKLVNEALSSHSLRHGLIRLNRDLGGSEDVLEAYVGHKLGGMKDVYGSGYSVESFRKAVVPVWQQLEKWIKL